MFRIEAIIQLGDVAESCGNMREFVRDCRIVPYGAKHREEHDNKYESGKDVDFIHKIVYNVFNISSMFIIAQIQKGA